MNLLSTGMNSICPGESEMVCHIPVHSKSENESRNEPCKDCLVVHIGYVMMTSADFFPLNIGTPDAQKTTLRIKIVKKSHFNFE